MSRGLCLFGYFILSGSDTYTNASCNQSMRYLAEFDDFDHSLSMSKPKTTRQEKEHQQLMRLAMSARDFRHALSAATFLIEECDWIKRHSMAERRKFHCYETTMVVAYGRPFAQSRGQVAPPFKWNMVPALELEPEEMRLHEQLLTYRNKLHAHSDSDFTNMSLEIWRTPLHDGEFYDFLAVSGGELLNFEENDVTQIHRMLWKIRHHIDDALQAHPASREGFPIIPMGRH